MAKNFLSYGPVKYTFNLCWTTLSYIMSSKPKTLEELAEDLETCKNIYEKDMEVLKIQQRM